MAEMEYRRLGSAGVRLSVLSFGSWVTFGAQMGMERALACMEAAHRAGVNFFDNAEVYAGASASVMGEAIDELGWPRLSYVVSTKFFWGLRKGVPNTQEHAQPQVPACRRSTARWSVCGSTSSTSSSATGPTRRRRSRRRCGR